MPKVILAIDYGLKRIGIAVGNDLIKIPHPLETIAGINRSEKLAKLTVIIDKWQPAQIIMGMPSLEYNNLQKQQLINTIQNFAKQIKKSFNLSVTFITEDFSSNSAVGLLNQQGIYGKAQKAKIDQLAACEILQTFFSLV